MDTILDLQKQLHALKQKSAARNVSERNSADLVQKLIMSDQVKLFPTASGKEYITPEQLDLEICELLESSGGRISITDLPNETGIALEHCEARVEQLRKKDGSLQKLHSELLTQNYVQAVAQEIEESLAEIGYLAVADLASRYSLPAEYIRSSVLAPLGSSEVIVKPSAVYTMSYLDRVEARARGILRGCTQPATLDQLAKRHGLDAEMLAAAAQTLLREEVVLGKLQGTAFTPKAYTAAQSSKVDSFFDANGYLTTGMAKSSNLNLKDWAKKREAAGYSLKSAFLASHLVDASLDSINDALAAGSWIDVQALLPPALEPSDASELLVQLSSQKRLASGAVLVERVALSSGFLQSIATDMEAQVAAAAEQVVKKPAAGRGGKKSAAAATVDDEDEGGGGSKKGKRAAKGGKKKRGGDEDDVAEVATDGMSSESGVPNQAILDYIEEKQPELPPDILDDICAKVQALLAAMVADAVEKLRSSLQSKQQGQFEKAEKLVQERYETLVLGLRSLEAAKLQESPLYQHLLKEVALEPLHALLALRLQEATGSATEVTAANRKQCLDKLVAAEGAAKADSLMKLAAFFAKGKDGKDGKESKDSKEGKEAKDKVGKAKKGREADEDVDAPDVADLYHAAADASHIFCRKVDKKREKAAAQEQRAAVKERLKGLGPSDSLSICHLGLQLALNGEGISCLVLPAELWAMRLAAACVSSELKDKSLELCELCEKADNSEAAVTAAAAWRDRFVGES
eukprot:TRINITY_DN91826_c0_g1_i1.p1 TRINITY_DN91826_c0_g1~~TRINITY_DN91826_c0_g1_i1.p1  ORF type:complete len:759 (-),score=243.82 TRINITY_DN91826_c0_g1_i1:65-2305(-)